MELRTLRYLLAVADEGSITAAAAVVRVAQPSLSRQLRGLERDLGLELFVRDGGRLRLSAAGRQFLPLARDLVVRADRARAVAGTIGSGRMQTVTIAAPGTTLTDVIAPFLATFRDGDPMPDVWEELPDAVYQALDRGADLAIGTTAPPRRLEGMPIAQLPVWAYVPVTHPWGSRGDVPLSELAEADLLVLTSDYHPRRALDDAVARVGLTLRVLRELDSAEVAQAIAAAGRGVAVVSDDPRFGLRALRISTADGDLTISLYAAWEPRHPGASTISGLAGRLTSFCQERYSTGS
ncbi:MAG: LysR family transcriptional regulator [Intrasporangium sp.]|uniref:LysR family transcriptional regulator n=1 Tax=Intrasporangium sp. TaxID=1925024 RepID=UPI002647B76C|nr:LysR family transcriptional regulator [Intrasporangium sp.]MDN5796371.1 LysR family transcriptional regulator [Intrasporangium sp.]